MSLNEHLDAVEKDDFAAWPDHRIGKEIDLHRGRGSEDAVASRRRPARCGDLLTQGQQVFNRLADLKIPTVAAIHGASAGGGYEVALACDYRVASDDPATRIGLPETTLGLIPAWGGCTRLPRLIGAEKAAEVILKGKLYSAQEALKIGLVDEIAPRDQLLDRAREKLRAGKRKMEGAELPASPASQGIRPSETGAGIRRPNVLTKSLIRRCRFRPMNRCAWSWTRLSSSAKRNRRKI